MRRASSASSPERPSRSGCLSGSKMPNGSSLASKYHQHRETDKIRCRSSTPTLHGALLICSSSTSSLAPMVGFHKQTDKRMKVLEEIMRLRMECVKFDYGDMYAVWHRAASSVGDEYVSGSEK